MPRRDFLPRFPAWSPVTSAAITTRPLRTDDWPNVMELFGRNGACGGCWCMWWRVPMGGKTWEAAKGERNRAAFQQLVETGAASGVLAFDGRKPIGWCSIGPRGDFPRLERSKALTRSWGTDTWSLNCLFVPAAARGQGVATALVAAAVDWARASGAAEIEAYPQALQPGERQAGAFVWTGVPALFEPLGFRRVVRPERGRTLYLLSFHR